jgi:Ca2+/H+ antiporter, TMEM165/GDT1 family
MGVVAISFGIIFLAEVVDTSGLATLVLGARFRARWVLLGVCAAMAVHVALAIAAGSLVALLPERPLEALLAVIFLAGAVWLLLDDDDDDYAPDLADSPRSAWGVVVTSFGVTALSEFADPTQLLVVGLAARYHDPVAVGIGSLLGLCAVSAIAVYAGNRLQRRVPMRWVTRATAAILVVLGLLSAIAAIRG